MSYYKVTVIKIISHHEKIELYSNRVEKRDQTWIHIYMIT